MANRKQVVEAIRQWLQEIGSDLLEDEDLNIDDELGFLLGEYLNEYDLCVGCRWYFSPGSLMRKAERLNKGVHEQDVQALGVEHRKPETKGAAK